MNWKARLNLYLWYIVIGTLIDLANTWRPIPIEWFWLHTSNPSWFHIIFFFVVTPLFCAVVLDVFRKGMSWVAFLEGFAFTLFFSIAEDWLYIFVYSLVVKKWMFPWDYSWMLHAYWPFIHQWFGQNWWLNLPTGYWIGIAVCIGLVGLAQLKIRAKVVLKGK